MTRFAGFKCLEDLKTFDLSFLVTWLCELINGIARGATRWPIKMPGRKIGKLHVK